MRCHPFLDWIIKKFAAKEFKWNLYGQKVLVGKAALLEQEGVEIIDEPGDRNGTIVYLAVNDR